MLHLGFPNFRFPILLDICSWSPRKRIKTNKKIEWNVVYCIGTHEKKNTTAIQMCRKLLKFSDPCLRSMLAVLLFLRFFSSSIGCFSVHFKFQHFEINFYVLYHWIHLFTCRWSRAWNVSTLSCWPISVSSKQTSRPEKWGDLLRELVTECWPLQEKW